MTILWGHPRRSMIVAAIMLITIGFVEAYGLIHLPIPTYGVAAIAGLSLLLTTIIWSSMFMCP